VRLCDGAFPGKLRTARGTANCPSASASFAQTMTEARRPRKRWVVVGAVAVVGVDLEVLGEDDKDEGGGDAGGGDGDGDVDDVSFAVAALPATGMQCRK